VSQQVFFPTFLPRAVPQRSEDTRAGKSGAEELDAGEIDLVDHAAAED